MGYWKPIDRVRKDVDLAHYTMLQTTSNRLPVGHGATTHMHYFVPEKSFVGVLSRYGSPSALHPARSLMMARSI